MSSLVTHAAQLAWQGYVYVQKVRQKPAADQSNAFLLLADQGRVITQPALEIYTDDVVCTHGATVGEIDADALFYMQARGIERTQAHALLTHALLIMFLISLAANNGRVILKNISPTQRPLSNRRLLLTMIKK